MAAEVFEGVIFERAGSSYMARINGHDNAPITQASLASVYYQIWEVGAEPEPPDFADPITPRPINGPTQIPVADCVFNTLQTDSRWTADATGYNFRHDMPATVWPAIPIDAGLSSKFFRIEYQLTPNVGAVIPLSFRVEMLQRLFGKATP